MKPITATSAIEFLIWLLIAASAIAMLAKRFRAPYTVALVAGGLMLRYSPGFDASRCLIGITVCKPGASAREL